MSNTTVTEALEELWDRGNCTGLDGWVGPGRGSAEVDDEALQNRRRDVEQALALISASLFFASPATEAGEREKAIQGRYDAAIMSRGYRGYIRLFAHARRDMQFLLNLTQGHRAALDISGAVTKFHLKQIAEYRSALERVISACDRIISNADGHKPPGPPNPTREQATAVRIRSAAAGPGVEGA